MADGADVVFCALPHGASQQLVPKLLESAGHVVDLAADFRLKDPGLYPAWYHEEHSCPELLAEAVYGLPELDRRELFGAKLVGRARLLRHCGRTGLAPLVGAGVVGRTGIVVDAASGVSGAGRKSDRKHAVLHGRRGLHRLWPVEPPAHTGNGAGHRRAAHFHAPSGPDEPGHPGHLLRPSGRGGGQDPLEVLADAYAAEPFVVVSERSPSTKATLGSNAAHLTARFDERTGWVVTICALDNLVKGAAGQAIQCANAVMGWPETTGLPVAGLAP